MPDTIQSFLQLLRMAVGVDGCTLSETLSPRDWTDILSLAGKQSVMGLLCRALAELPAGQQPSLKVRSQINLAGEMMAKKNRKLTGYAREITETFAQMGFKSCVLKGQGVARLYPDPSLRHCGDIDLWVEGERDEVVRALEGKWKREGIFYHHTGIRPFKDRTEVEVHFTPSWMNNPFRNRRLQKYFRQNAGRQCSNYIPELGFAVPKAEFDLVYSAIHIYRHLLQDGVGLRQIIDYYFILKNSSAEDRQKALEVLDSLGMLTFAGALMFVEKELFVLPDEFLLCAPDERFGKFFMEEIFLSGNFGKYDKRYRYDSDRNIFVRAFQRCGRLLHFLKYAPSEVLWAPYYKIWQRLLYIR